MTQMPDPSLVSHTFAEHLQQPMPEFLYHYTSQEGLLGIGHFANTDPVRASRANERKERADVFWRLAMEIDASPINVSCFCENGDLLSQWRGYAGDGYGYSFGFNPSKLNRIASNSGFILGKCIYDSNLHKQIIREGVDYLLTKATPEHSKHRSLSRKLETNNDFWTLMTFGACFKHPSFKQEQEWRLISDPNSDRGTERFFRKGKSMIIPYTSLSIRPADDLGIDHVFVGPCPHMSLSVRSAADMLLCNGIDVNVHPSSIPFRDW